MNPVLILGAGSLGKLALDAFLSNDVVVYGFLDDNTALHKQTIGEIPILGAAEDDGYWKLIGKKCDVFVAVSNPKERKYLDDQIRERRHLAPVNAIHRDSSVSTLAALGHGNLISAGCRIAPFSELGNGSLLHPNVVLGPDAKVGDRVELGAGTHVGEGTKIGDGAFIGAGVTLIEGISIGKNASVGAGSVVLADVPANTRVFGFPAQKVGS
jgi:sugar O-acyltransferase (sialic acid O-acetyltransferase NeuD family)